MKRIVAPTDFSPASLNAVNYAADMACALKGSLSLIHVFQLPIIYSEVPVAIDNTDDSVKEAEEKIRQLKDDITKRTGGEIEINTEVKVGSVIPETESFCSSVHPYSVVMGTQGAGAVERFFFGSNTILAVKNLSWPLIVVPPDAKFTSIKKIGLACDLKKVVETAPVEEIKSLVKEFSAELHVLHVNREAERIYTPETRKESALLQEMLEELHPVYHFVSNADIDEGLVEFAEKNNLDLLIVVPKKHNLVDKLFHKSHTKQLVLNTHVPVMSVHE
jgi:nucleotide-binding universal stress UspA family protein